MSVKIDKISGIHPSIHRMLLDMGGMIDVSDCKTTAEAMQKARIDFDIATEPARSKSGTIENIEVCVRLDTGEQIGTISPSYAVKSAKQLFTPLDEFVEKGCWQWIAGGESWFGSVVYLVGDTFLETQITPTESLHYLVAAITSYDRTVPYSVMLVPVQLPRLQMHTTFTSRYVKWGSVKSVHKAGVRMHRPAEITNMLLTGIPKYNNLISGILTRKMSITELSGMLREAYGAETRGIPRVTAWLLKKMPKQLTTKIHISECFQTFWSM